MDPSGGQPETLIASMTLVFEDLEPEQARARTRELLAGRRVIALVSVPVDWNGVCILEVHLAVDGDGLLQLATADGQIRDGQQVEDFAFALKRGTGARYLDMQDVEISTDEPIDDDRLERMPAGRTVLVGRLTEAELVSLAGAHASTWHLLPDDGTGHRVAVHDGFLVGGLLGSSNYPAMLLSRSGPRYAASFWFPRQPRALAGWPAWTHVWPLAATPVLHPAPGSRAEELIGFLSSELSAPDSEALTELAHSRIDAADIQRLAEALGDTGGPSAAHRVLQVFGYPQALADYLGGKPIPDTARRIAPRGFAQMMSQAVTAEARAAKGAGKFFNVFAWRPATQLIWGVIEALVFTGLLLFTDWQHLWLPRWLWIAILVLGLVDAAGNLVIGGVRAFRARRRRESHAESGG